MVNIEVSLSPDLQRYQLPAPPTGKDLVEAVQASLRTLDVAGDRVTVPVYRAIRRAALGNIDNGLHLFGTTGGGKTELATLAQRHYGPGMGARSLPGSWLSTDNALENLAFSAKDAVLVVDVRPGQGDIVAGQRPGSINGIEQSGSCGQGGWALWRADADR